MKIRHFFILIIALVASINASSQNIITSRQSSKMTYVFKLTDKQVEKIYKKGVKKINDNYFTNIVDSFPTDSQFNKTLDVGYYLFANAYKGNVEYKIHTQSDIFVYSLENIRDISFKVFNSDKEIVDNAKVFVKNKRIKFDKKTQSYRLAKGKKQGLVKIKYQDKNYYFSLFKEYNYRYYGFPRIYWRSLFWDIGELTTCWFNKYSLSPG